MPVRSVLRLLLLAWLATGASAGNAQAQVNLSRTLFDVTGPAPQARLGQSLASMGDLNGDGIPDFAIASPFGGRARSDSSGQVLIYYGGSPGPKPEVVLSGFQAGAMFGSVVAPIGDWNGDGWPDLIVTAPNYAFANKGLYGSGRAYIYFWGAAADTIPDVVIDPTRVVSSVFTGIPQGFGIAAAGIGDIDHDGRSDFAVGLANAAGVSPNGGAVIYLSSEGIRETTTRFFRNTGGGRISIAGPGDVNGDGIPDVAMGDPTIRPTFPNAIFQIWSGNSQWNSTPLVSVTSTTPGFAASIAAAGDLDHDGYPDMVIGQPMKTGHGQAFVWFGGRFPSPMMIAIPSPSQTAATADSFGTAVAAGDIDGDGTSEILVGCPGDRAGGAGAGAVFVFKRVWPGPAYFLQAWTGAPGEYFGSQVVSPGDLDRAQGDEMVVGAPRGSATALNAGRAVVLSLSLQRLLEPTGGNEWLAGGTGDVSWSGAAPAKVELSLDDGRSWQVLADNIGGAETNHLSVAVPDTVTAHALVRVGPAGSSFVASAPDACDYSLSIVRPAAGWAAAPAKLAGAEGRVRGERFGATVASGDLDGDGRLDRAIGAPLAGGASPRSGTVRIEWGDPSRPAVAFDGASPGDDFGAALAVGDINHDGHADLLVGCPGSSARGLDSGHARLYFDPAGAPLELDGPGAGAGFGAAVTWIRDWNLDGVGSFAISAPEAPAAPGGGVGRVYLYVGTGAQGTGPSAILDAPNGVVGFGRAIRGLDDLNGDQCSDLAVSGIYAASGRGAVFIYYGGRTRPVAPAMVLRGENPGDLFGEVLADAGDLNGDRIGDLAVGAPLAETAHGRTGRVYVFNGGGIPSRSLAKQIDGETDGERFGAAITAAGDLNGDGRADLVIGAPDAAGGTGAVRAVFGGGDLLPDLEWRGNSPGGRFGAALAAGSAASLLAGAPLAAETGAIEELTAPRFVLEEPTAATRWFAGGTHEIRWLGAEPADVMLSTDDGRAWSVAGHGAGGALENVLRVQAPATPTDSVRVRLVPARSGVSGSAASDPFAIRAAGTLDWLTLDMAEDGLHLAWRAEPGVGPQGWRGYRIYRLEGDAAPSRIGPERITESAIVLAETRRGATYALRAVNGYGEEQELGQVSLAAAPAGMRAWPSPSVAGAPVNLAMFPPLDASGKVAGDFVVRVYDVTGRQVRFLASGTRPSVVGEVRVKWDDRADGGRDVNSGIYFVRAEVPSRGWRIEHRVVVVR